MVNTLYTTSPIWQSAANHVHQHGDYVFPIFGEYANEINAGSLQCWHTIYPQCSRKV